MPMVAIRTPLGFDTILGFDTPSATQPGTFVQNLLNRRYGLLSQLVEVY